ncbi:Alg9-like mannosyltransferase family-domain-containing protein [Earliella scabrosa]|nr:Alg9-like mannosyltransferase family-domain-containing protein [Earliella scabrosa]
MAEVLKRHSRVVYLALLALRLLFALFGTGYIHPDEYFQNGEAVAGRVLGLHTLSTWEWDPIFPCRSIVPAWVTTGIPLMVAKLLSQNPVLSPKTIFAAERLSFFLSSLLLDYAIYHLVHESARSSALILLASSYVTLTYQVRPFSNSIEAILVALSLVLLRKMLLTERVRPSTQTGTRYLALSAFVVICGIFTRITFAAFYLPIGLEVLKWTLRKTNFSLQPWARMLAVPTAVAALTLLAFVCADSAYFVSPARTSVVELTPLNFLRYNLLPANLAEHGLHPRWLHLLVNLPMVATPGLLFYALWAEWDYSNPRTDVTPKDKYGVVETMQKAFYWVRWSGTTLLSIQPHQEPRFLIPLVTPMVALVVNHGRILRAGKLFWASWILSNVVLALLFGVLHQGGVLPSIFRVHDIVFDPVTGIATQDIRVVYWKTYMPPRHLLAVAEDDVTSEAVTIADLAGSSPDGVVRALRIPPPTTRNLAVLLVAPIHAMGSLGTTQACLTERNRVFPHLDLDHIGEAVEVGWRDGLSLGIFEVDRTCLDSVVPMVSV